MSGLYAVCGTATAQTMTQNQSSSLTAEQFINQAALCGMKEVATGKIAKRKAQDKKIKNFGTMMVDDHEKANTELIALAKSKSINVPKQSDIMPSSSFNNNGSTIVANPTGNLSGTAASTAIGGSTTNSTGNTTSGGTTNTGNGTNANAEIGNTTNVGGNNGNTIAAGTTAASENKSHNKQGNGQANVIDQVTSITAGNNSLKMVTASDVSSAILQLDGLSGSQFDTAYIQMMVTDHKNAVALFERGTTSPDPDIKAYATRHLPTLRSHEKHVQSLSAGTAIQDSTADTKANSKSNQ